MSVARKPAPAAPVEDLLDGVERLLEEREAAEVRLTSAMASVRQARNAFEEAERAEKRVSGPEQYATAVVATQTAREALAAASQEMVTARAPLADLTRRVNASWNEAVQLAGDELLPLRIEREAEVRAAAAQVAHAVRRLNAVNSALALPYYPPVRMKDPANPDFSATDEPPPGAPPVSTPLVDRVASVRRMVESRRGG